MANVQHAALTGTDLHEPKGAATASAFDVYVADGTGSGVWTTSPHGWALYADSKTGASVQTITSTASKLEIDGAGASTVITQLPPAIRGSGNLWDTTNDKFTPMEVHDSYVLTLSMTIAAETTHPTSLTLEFDIGGTGSVSNVILTHHFLLGKTTPYTLEMTTGSFVTSTMLTNGATLYVKTDTGTIDVNDVELLIQRVHGGGDW